MNLVSQHKGEIAQLKVQLAAANKGFLISKPQLNLRYDVIIDTTKKLIRSQIKYCDQLYTDKKNKNRIVLRLENNCGKKCYTSEQIDLLLVYVVKLDKILAYEPKIFHKLKTLYIQLKNKKSRWFYENFVW